MWPLARHGTAAVCEQCEISVQDPRYNLRSEQGQPSYGWRCVKIIDGGQAIGRAKKEGRNSYGGVWYQFYGKLLRPTGWRDGQAVLQLHPALDLLHHGPVSASGNAETLDGSALGATAGVSVATRDGLCRPQLQRKAFWGISQVAGTRPSTTHAEQPRLSNR